MSDAFKMPYMDKHVGKCGMYVYKKNGYCNQPGAVRMSVVADDSDESRYNTGPYFVPYVGDEVAVVLCEEHQGGVADEFTDAKREIEERESQRKELQAKVDAARAVLEEAEAELRRV